MSIFKKNQPPYICVPITGKTKTEIFEQLETVVSQAPDIIEWRADFFDELGNVDETVMIANEIKEKTDIPLLFTIRAAHEGGEEIPLTDEEKVDVLRNICLRTTVDLVDFETSNKETDVKKIQTVAKENSKQLILSYHNFDTTPDNRELVDRAKQAATLGADMIKIAVMPQSKTDVFRLLEVTREIDSMFEQPIISMSMGDIGGLSRVIGWAYGSILTFGVGVKSSAPGQMPVKQLRDAIQNTQELVPSWI